MRSLLSLLTLRAVLSNVGKSWRNYLAHSQHAWTLPFQPFARANLSSACAEVRSRCRKFLHAFFLVQAKDFSLVPRRILVGELGRSWLASAKIARKAGQWQTAYSAMLQAQQNKARFTFMESAKLVKVMGEPLRAIQELENSMRSLGLLDDNILDLTGDDEETHKMKAKVWLRFLRFYAISDLGVRHKFSVLVG